MALFKLLFRLSAFAALVCVSSAVSHAYTRAYLTNGTGMTVYGLHVKLKNPAQSGSLGSGLYSKIFNQITLSADGSDILFSNPLSPQGIESGASVWVGWSDAQAGLSSDIFDYWWTDLSGNMVGTVQSYDPNKTGDDGGMSDLLALLTGGDSPSYGSASGGGGSGDGSGKGANGNGGTGAWWPGAYTSAGYSSGSNSDRGGNNGDGGYQGFYSGDGNGSTGGPTTFAAQSFAASSDVSQLIATPEIGSLPSVAIGFAVLGLLLIRRRVSGTR